jgi:hypothetical protein
VHTVELAIDDPDAGAERVQLRGEREPGGPGADDQNGELLLERTLPGPGRQESQPMAGLTEFADPPVLVLTPREFLDRLEP